METVRNELAPTGVLRVAIAIGPPGSPMWATRDPATGKPRGVTLDLGAALADKLGVPVVYVEHASTGEITEAVGKSTWDVAFMPVDDERKKRVDFGPNYSLGESTYLIAPGVVAASVAEVDRPGMRVVGVENTTTIRAARRSLAHATVAGTTGANDTLTLMRAGKVDAIALGRDTLEIFAAELPGSRVLDDHFWAVGIAIAVPKGRPASLAYVSDFIEAAKSDGTVQRAFDAARLKGAKLAPAGSRS